LAGDLLARTDAELLAVPTLDELTDRQLLALLGRVGEALESVHGHEVLLGLLVTRSAPRFTGASVALRVLANARADGLDDEVIAARHPVVLALVAPHVQPVAPLPWSSRRVTGPRCAPATRRPCCARRSGSGSGGCTS
jgi:pyruvate,water dikinase